MTDKITNYLFYEVLKNMQESISKLDNSMRELKDGQIYIREDINSLRGEFGS